MQRRTDIQSRTAVKPMKCLRIKDNRQVKKTEFREIENLTERIVDKTLDRLEQEGIFVFPRHVADSDDLSGTQTILQSLNDSFRSGNVMGFIGYGDERLIIESRFSNDREDYFFQYLYLLFDLIYSHHQLFHIVNDTKYFDLLYLYQLNKF